MSQKFEKVRKAIAKAIKGGKIPKTYISHGHRLKSNPYALARYALRKKS